MHTIHWHTLKFTKLAPNFLIWCNAFGAIKQEKILVSTMCVLRRVKSEMEKITPTHFVGVCSHGGFSTLKFQRGNHTEKPHGFLMGILLI